MATMDWSKQGGSGPAAYDEFLVPAMFANFAEVLVERAPVLAGSRVLDVACGTGAASRAAARRAGSNGAVSGLDLGEPTLAVARSHPAEPGAAPVEYRQADAGSLPVEDHAFDVALCQQGLQFFPDRHGALREMRRALKPGGRLALATWTAIDRSPMIAVAGALGRHVGPEAEQMMHSPWALSDPVELRDLVAGAGFVDVTVEAITLDCIWASHIDFGLRTVAAGPVASVFAAVPEEVKLAFAQDVAERLEPYATPDGRVEHEMTTNVAFARA